MWLIGIDPGTDTGIARYSTDRRDFVEVTSMPIHRAMDEVRLHKEASAGTGQQFLVIFEDARKRQYFGVMDEKTAKYGNAVREGAGAAKRDATIWEDFLTDLGVPFVARKPANTKHSAPYFRALTGWTKRTNEHARDAGMLVFGYTTPMAEGEILNWKQRTGSKG